MTIQTMLTFIIRNRNERLTGRPRSVFVLTTDNWDDFGHKIQFHLAYIDEVGNEKRIGAVKILCRKASDSDPIDVTTRTKLPETFNKLDDRFVSLGQEDDYYTGLHLQFGEKAEGVLVALRDIAWQPTLAIPFEATTAFRNALMRDNGAHRARRFGRAWAIGQAVQETLDFAYSCQIDGADQPVDVKVQFNDKDRLPGRVVGIIGRNAVGKTRFLANLGEDLTQISRTSAERLAERDQRFPEGRPLFTRIIAISYGAFDRFKRPAAHASSSYVYCGIRNEKGNLSRVSLVETYKNNQVRIRDLAREAEWTTHMRTILGDQSASLAASLQAEIAAPSTDEETLSRLSSGQAILCHFTTALLAWIQPNTLVLFDEPETHLHPNAVASLFLVLADILASYDSYAIIATHSPVVIQEIPAKRVVVFRREGNLTVADPLSLESFGESVTELTRHVFETIEVESLYRRTLRGLASHEDANDVLARFPMGLSLSAQAYLLAQYGTRQGNGG
jgi:ABC-type cobalamin/Fe3+-siderophores transport system ATPase subunit